MPDLINVANRLPVTLAGGEIKKSSGGLVAALEGVRDERFRLRWLGWPGKAVDDPAGQATLRDKLASEIGATPVFFSEAQAEGFYEGFSNSSLWPVLHYLPSYMSYESRWWDAYRDVNRKFADAVLEIAGDDDLVWVHDYQLMLVPAMLREARPALRIGFFLHTPFPSYEVFRIHPRRDELLEGVLGADRIGFHTFGYLRHFRSAVLRLLGVESEITRIRRETHTAVLGVYPIGIDARKFDEEPATPQFKAEAEKFRADFHGMRVVVSVERLDYTKGILHRLDAIELFLDGCDDRDAIKFIFVSVPSRENVGEYQTLREEVESRVGRINGKYATLHNSPIHFIHGSVDFHELCALYRAACVGLVTPLIDGMNLVAKEYVAAQDEADPGVLVLSEFAGAAEELLGAVVVNPYDAASVAGAVREALAMPREERRARAATMRDRVRRFDATWWARTFVDDLSAPLPPSVVATVDADEAMRRVRDAVAARRRVALFLDYDGTLREIERDPAAAARPNAATRATLDRLAGAAGVDVTVISGRTAADLEAFLGPYPFGLIAEHGAALRRPRRAEWERLDRNVSYAWKDELRRVLQLYVDSTPGSFVEEKRTGLVWHYRKTDPEFGEWKARQLVAELGSLTAGDPVQVRHGKKIVEVSAADVSKGTAVERVLDDKKYDLILLAGDDATDETMFRLKLGHAMTVKVGEGETAAKYRVGTPREFRRLLEEALVAPDQRGK